MKAHALWLGLAYFLAIPVAAHAGPSVLAGADAGFAALAAAGIVAGVYLVRRKR